MMMHIQTVWTTSRKKKMNALKAVLGLSAIIITIQNPVPVLLLAGVWAVGPIGEKNGRRRR